MLIDMLPPDYKEVMTDTERVKIETKFVESYTGPMRRPEERLEERIREIPFVGATNYIEVGGGPPIRPLVRR